MSDTGSVGQGMRIGGARRPLPSAGARPMPRRLLRRPARWPRARAGDVPPWRPLSLRWAHPAPAARAAGRGLLSVSTFHWHFHMPVLRLVTHRAAGAAMGSATAKDGTRAGIAPMSAVPAAAPTDLRQPPGRVSALGAPRVATARHRRTIIGRASAPDRQGRAPWTVSETRRTGKAVAAAGGPRDMRGVGQAWQAGASGIRSAALAHTPPAMPASVTRRPAAVTSADLAPGGSRERQGPAVATAVPAASPATMVAPITTAWRPAAARGWAGSGGAARQPRARLAVPLPWPAAAQRVHAVSAPRQPSEREGGAAAWQAASRAGAAVAAAGMPARSATRRPVKLVWAAVHGGGGRPAEPRHHDVVMESLPAISATPAAGAARSEPGHVRDGTIVRATALDPLLASRLADEVMRRIDQRARIERERRGL